MYIYAGRILSPALLLMCSNAIKCCQPLSNKAITVKHPGLPAAPGAHIHIYIFIVARACDKLLCHCNLDSSRRFIYPTWGLYYEAAQLKPVRVPHPE